MRRKPLPRLAHPAIERPHAHAQALCCLAAGNIACLIAIAYQLKLRRARLARSTETDPSRPRRCNPLRLAPMNILALHLRHVAQQL